MLDDELDLELSALDGYFNSVFRDLWENGNHSDHTFENTRPALDRCSDSFFRDLWENRNHSDHTFENTRLAEEDLDTFESGSSVYVIDRSKLPSLKIVLENVSMFQDWNGGFESAEKELDQLSSKTKALELVEADSY